MSPLKPVTSLELQDRKPRPATRIATRPPVRHSFYVTASTADPPGIGTSVTKISSHLGRHVYRVDLEPDRSSDIAFGSPPMPYKILHRGEFTAAPRGIAIPHSPDFVQMTYTPRLPVARKRRRPLRLMLKDKPVRPLEIFPPDRRQQLLDFSYPWGTVGRTVSPVGDGTVKVATGTLVGPRHMLTASHVIGWDNPGGPSVSFSPGYSNGPGALGTAFGIYGYWYREIDEPGDQLDVSEDYVVVVLDQRMGDTLGWMGTTTYDTDWDNLADFFNIGYPVDLGGNNLPFWQNLVSIEDADNPGIFGQEGDGLYMDTETASLAKGNSGGPFFDYFTSSDPSYPDGWYIIGVASAEGTLDWTFDDDNWLAGGSPMPDLVNQARSDYP